MNDLISRQWLMECVNEGWIKFDTEKDENRFIHLVRDIAPPVTPQHRTGYWVYEGEGSGYKKWHCSNCKMLVRNPKKPWYDFCPNCGERKVEPQEKGE